MAAAATFTYAGAGTAVAHVTGATIGHSYFFGCSDADSSGVTVVAASASFDIVVSTIGGIDVGETFEGVVYDNTLFGTVPGATIFAYGVAGEYESVAEFAYDGGPDPTGILEVTFFAENGVEYRFQASGEFLTQNATPIVGSGAEATMQITLAPGYEPTAGSQFYANLWTPDGSAWAYFPRKNRLFAWGTPGVGALGNPAPPAVEAFAPEGVTQRTAVFQGEANPEGVPSTVVFEYGLSTSYGETTPEQDIGSGTDPVPVTQFVEGLRPGRTYHYRLVRSP